MVIDNSEQVRTVADGLVGGEGDRPISLKSLNNQTLPQASHKLSHKLFDDFRAWAARHPSDESARCLLDLAYLERHPDDQTLLPLFVADFHKLEAKMR